VLKKNGRNEFVVLPYEEYRALEERLADAEDLLALRRARRGDNPQRAGLTLAALKKHLSLKARSGRRRK
jgi:PHD/YefM family antitoxin component YafN of YafNO toxin-antitoxin module